MVLSELYIGSCLFVFVPLKSFTKSLFVSRGIFQHFMSLFIVTFYHVAFSSILCLYSQLPSITVSGGFFFSRFLCFQFYHWHFFMFSQLLVFCFSVTFFSVSQLLHFCCHFNSHRFPMVRKDFFFLVVVSLKVICWLKVFGPIFMSVCIKWLLLYLQLFSLG